MKKRVILSLGVLIFAFAFVNAAHIVETSDGENSFKVEVNKDFVYNFSVENSDSGNNSEIIQVNITIPSAIRVSGGSQFTDASYDDFFSQENVLSWQSLNDSLLDPLDTKYFGFRARANASGNYTFKIDVVNSSGVYSYNIPVEIYIFQCVQNWICAEWSECVGEQKIRVCYDSNSCGNETGKPIETESCMAVCIPVYSCGEWTPNNCPKEEIQTRVCTDINNCGTLEGKPEEQRACQANSKLFFIILVVIVVTFIILFVLILIDMIRKRGDEKITFDKNWNNKKGNQNNQM